MVTIKGDGSGAEVPSFLKNFYKELKKSSNAKQLGVGVVTGWGTGYIAAKFGKIAATALGGSLLLIQLAKYNGYIDIDWDKLNKDISGTKEVIKANKPKLPLLVQACQDFASENVVLAGGFASGFLLGMASA